MATRSCERITRFVHYMVFLLFRWFEIFLMIWDKMPGTIVRKKLPTCLRDAEDLLGQEKESHLLEKGAECTNVLVDNFSVGLLQEIKFGLVIFIYCTYKTYLFLLINTVQK